MISQPTFPKQSDTQSFNQQNPSQWIKRCVPNVLDRRFSNARFRLYRNFVACMETWPQFRPVAKEHSLWIDDETFNEMSNRWEFNVTPYELHAEPANREFCHKHYRPLMLTTRFHLSLTPVEEGLCTHVSRVPVEQIYRYADDRNKVENPATSGLSPWFHFGHISTVEVQSCKPVAGTPVNQMPRKGSTKVGGT